MFLDSSARRSGTHRDADFLQLGFAAWVFHLQREHIDARKIRAGAIKRDETGDFERQTLFVVGGSHLTLFNCYASMLGG